MMDLWATVPYYTAYLSQALLRQGADVTVGSITYYLDPECFRSRGLSLRPGALNIVGRFRLPKYPRQALKLVESMLNLSALTLRFLVSPPTIIHVQFLAMFRSRMPLDLWFVRFFRRRGVKIVLTVHDLLPHDTGQRYKKKFLDLYHGVDEIICHSGHIALLLEQEFDLPADRISIIPHGPFFYDLPVPDAENVLSGLELSQELNQDRPIFLFQGIIFPYKGVDLLLDAWRRVEDETTEPCLVIAGTGSPALIDQLRSQIVQLGLKRVHLRPRFLSTEELVALYRAAAVIVYPYRAVTTSGALATGLALGKTIVASDLNVFRELLVHNESALLIDPADRTQFASALLRLAAEPELRKKLSSRVQALNFGDQSWDEIASTTIEVYRKAAS